MSYKNKNDKMSGKPNKFDPNCVSQRVLQTKKEIEQLKLELQQLINRGTETETSNINVIEISENKDNELQKTKTVHCSLAYSSLCKSVNITQNPIPCTLPKRNYQAADKNKETSPKRIRHYNVEEARDYIKKQKERRQEKMKTQMKESNNEIIIRKEKLKELQKRSLELVQKNVNLKRERSLSRERGISQTKTTLQNNIEKNVLPVEKIQVELPTCSERHGFKVPDLNIDKVPVTCSNENENMQMAFDFKNVCVRNENDSKLIPFQDLLNLQNEERHKAAIKIQSFYRGYCQRKCYKHLVKMKRQKANYLEKNMNLITSTEIENKSEKDSVEPPKEDVPFWLQTSIQPYPYNFISAVKRKLNLAVNSPIKTSSDVGIQIYYDEPQKDNFGKDRDEIKKALVESTNNRRADVTSCMSRKSLGLNLERVEELHLQNDEFHRINSDCDTKKISLVLNETHSKKQHIDMLQTEGSESDTSKNIPDISSETTLHSTNNSNLSEYKLEIDVNKLNSLKLRKKFNITENTMDIANDYANKQGKISLEEVPKIAEYVENSSNLRVSENVETDFGSNILQNSKNFSHKEDNHLKSNANSKSVNITSFEKPINHTQNIPDTSKGKGSQFSAVSHKVIYSEINTLSPKENDSICSPIKSLPESSISNMFSKKRTGKLEHNEVEFDENLQSFLEYMTSLEETKKSRRSIHQKSSSMRTSNSFKSLLSRSQKSSESVDHSSTARKESLIEENYSSNFSNSTSSVTSSVPLLKRPSVTLTTSENMNLPIQEENRNTIFIKPGEVKCIETKTNTNQIHLKFEAELHLLNDFNESLRQFMAVEKSLLELQSKSQQNITVYQNQDTQTTDPFQQAHFKDLHDSVHSETVKSQASTRVIPTINYSRGSDVTEELHFGKSDFIANDDKILATGLDLSQLNGSSNSSIAISLSNTSFHDKQDVSFTRNAYAGFSLGMFDQLIKDEDARIENLKTILKIREKALLDRTKGELAWLEIQKKHLIETGQVHEASLLKKKQRGIIIKLQHEKQEMQRLKQIQKAASKERKTILKEQRNMIKAQLSNNTSLPKIRPSLHKGKRNVGPVKVYNLHRETINTETSISRRSSLAEDIVITSRSDSIISHISEEVPHDQDNSMILNTSFKSILSKKTEEEAKKTLLMREAALQKRRKAAEDLLQWHQRLLEEERKIAELEVAANTIIKQVPTRVADSICKAEEEQYDLKGSQLNILWTNMTCKKERKFVDEQIYTFSQTALEKFCKDAINNCDKFNSFKELNEKSNITNNKYQATIDEYSDVNESDLDNKPSISQSLDVSVKSTNESIKSDSGRSNSTIGKDIRSPDKTNTYSLEFNSPEVIEECTSKDDYILSDIFKSNSSVHTEGLVNEIDKSKSTLNEIMQNISNITDEISAIYKLSSVANTIKDESIHPVLKTNKDNTSVNTQNIYSTTKQALNKENASREEDVSDDDTLKTSLQSEIVKSLTELISSQNACQDIKSEQKHNIIETPESVCSKNTLTDSQATLESNSEIYTNCYEVEYEVNKLKDNKQDELLLSNTLNKELSVQDVMESRLQEDTCCITEDVLINKHNDNIHQRKQSNQSVDSDMCSNIVENIFSVNESQNQYSEDTSNGQTPNVLDLSYGFTGVRTKKNETTSFSSDNKNEIIEDQTNVCSEIHTENGFDGKEVQINNSNNPYKEAVSTNSLVTANKLSENLSKSKMGIKTTYVDNSLSPISENLNFTKNIQENSISNDVNKSIEETTISTESEFGKSMSINEVNDTQENQKIPKFQLISENENVDILKQSSLIKTIEVTGNNKDLAKENIVSNEDNLTNVETILDKNLLQNDACYEKCSKNFDHSNDKSTLETEISELNNNNTLDSISLDRNITIADCYNKSDVIIDNILNNSFTDELNLKAHGENLTLECDKNTYKDRENRETSKSTDRFDTFAKEENVVDVKKRVSQILADTNILREDKSPRLQDIYTTTYDILSPENSPEIGSPVTTEKSIVSVTQLFDEEAEALFKKQLAIEQEIKQLEQQQKEHIPYMYMREIPNKPPPPYTPPITAQIHVTNVLPSSPEQLQSVTSSIAEKLFKAYENGNIENAATNMNDESKLLKKTNVDKECYEFMFDLCKEFAIDHYKEFVEETGPSWIFVNKKPLAKVKPFNKDELKKYLYIKVKEVLGFEKVIFKENMITKWSRKKRDHVDELLVIESQAEESEWTNYDDDEIIVKNELTNDIMNMLLTETANVIGKIFTKKMSLS